MVVEEVEKRCVLRVWAGVRVPGGVRHPGGGNSVGGAGEAAPR